MGGQTDPAGVASSPSSGTWQPGTRVACSHASLLKYATALSRDLQNGGAGGGGGRGEGTPGLAECSRDLPCLACWLALSYAFAPFSYCPSAPVGADADADAGDDRRARRVWGRCSPYRYRNAYVAQPHPSHEKPGTASSYKVSSARVCEARARVCRSAGRSLGKKHPWCPVSRLLS